MHTLSPRVIVVLAVSATGCNTVLGLKESELAPDATAADTAAADTFTADTFTADGPGVLPDSSRDAPAGDADADAATAHDTASNDVADEGSVDVAADACSEAGACAPGTTRSVACGMCGTEIDTCSPGCAWTVGACTGEGVCAPGSTSADPTGCSGILVKSRVCRVDCLWAGYSACDVPVGWTPIAPATIIPPRAHAATVWTGSEMLVMAGDIGSGPSLKDGAAYSPISNTWRRLADAPTGFSASVGHVWTGDTLLLWPLAGSLRSYSPATDTWTLLAPDPIGDGRTFPNAVWSPITGEAIFWSGSGVATATDGVAYKVSTGTWRVIASAPLTPRWGALTAYAGGRILFYAGAPWDGGPAYPTDGAIYDPVADTWTKLADASHGGDYFGGGAAAVVIPSAPERAALWSGASNEGFFTDPVANTSVALPPAPSTVTLLPSDYAWSSDRWVFLWSAAYASGAYYDAVASTWSALPTAGAPSKRRSAGIVDRNGTLIVWSGKEVATGSYVDNGAILRPF